MNTFFTNAIAWIKANVLIAVAVAVVLILVLFPKIRHRLFGGKTVRRRSRIITTASRRRRIPRSVGLPVARTKSGKAKKPWQIKGSEAARRHMAQIRKMR
jgi:hypothetical protein